MPVAHTAITQSTATAYYLIFVKPNLLTPKFTVYCSISGKTSCRLDSRDLSGLNPGFSRSGRINLTPFAVEAYRNQDSVQRCICDQHEELTQLRFDEPRSTVGDLALPILALRVDQ